MIGFFKPAQHIERLPQDRHGAHYKALRWQIFLSIFFGYAAYYLVRKNISLAVPDLLKLGFTKTDMGFVMSAGALDSIEKQALDSELFVAIRTVASGRRYMSPDNAEVLLDQLLSPAPQAASPDPYAVLTAREREVLKLLVRGHTLTQIAGLLHLSVKTIDTHKTHVMEKLNLTHKSQLVDYALRHGLLARRGGV